MIKSLFAAAALIAVPAIAQAEEAKSTFTYQGVDYTYTAAQEGNVKVLRGTALNGTAPFELRVTKSGV
ncbi:MAG TPA: hypothetical protein VFF94_16475, partial [Novosphingobium sp.]|nr:hypothetical protein [Novosphingobium sp.]